jgi:D-amino-acid oxidase
MSDFDSARFEPGRRRFLQGAIATSALLAARSAHLHALARETNLQRHFAPVKVARNRIIREVVGLRPYRSAGFVVETERLGKRLLIHNYGHGGAGVTLSWGTAALALDLARPFLQTAGTLSASTKRRFSKSSSRKTPTRFAVLGCGVNGLSTARLLQRHFQDGPGTVTIYARDLPPETTSNVAGAFWYPASAFDPQEATAKFTDQFQRACLISNKAFQTLVGSEYGVRWLDTFQLLHGEASFDQEPVGGAQLYPQIEQHRDPEHYFGYAHVRQFSTMMIEPNTYLNALLRDFYVAGGRIVAREFRNRAEIGRLRERVIFNCTGLGSRALFGDDELIPVRGQLEILLPQPEIDYCYLGPSAYMFPRRDGIILGGTWDHEDWSLEPNPEQTTSILQAHAEIMKGLKESKS